MEYTIGLYKTELINNLEPRKTLASVEVATAECNAPAGGGWSRPLRSLHRTRAVHFTGLACGSGR